MILVQYCIVVHFTILFSFTIGFFSDTKVACLQEAPNHRHLRRDFLREVQRGVDGLALQSAEQSTSAQTPRSIF